ncbi:VWA domain-containing protein [Clostridium sp.]|uniref:vWA domain-containing protein n=1 Tax=Clostridium sp. TaxID=1506 RepID=UPI00346474C6
MKKRISYKAILCIGLIICMTATLVMTSASNANADVATKPAFDVKINSVSPEFPKVGEDITVSGEIVPKEFESEVPAKEIVLVLDVSGSMDWNINVECTNERVRYCIAHDRRDCEDTSCSLKYHSNGWYYCNEHKGWSRGYNEGCNNRNHKWLKDYCVQHRSEGAHTIRTTKISELKKAANNFVDKMSGVPNLKIGIVTYSYNATIKKVDRETLIDANKVKDLKNIINNLNANGGTNTGEGLRKAEYILENGDPEANKTVVLMSDGLPNGYSVTADYRDYYTAIDDANPNVYGDTVKLNSTSYSTTIGSIIKGTANNAFSIGYDLGDENSTSNKTLKSIHESMGGVDNNFFASNDGAIDNVFQQIATEILSTYAINNVKMELNLKSGFSLSVGGNNVDIDNILYKTDGEIKNGKVTYKADPVPFKFIIKSEVAGQHELFNGSKVSLPWKNENITVPVPSININIDKNELPNITAKLTSSPEVDAYSGDEIEVTYDVIGEDFIYKDSSSNMRKKDIAIVLDVSKSMLKSGKLDEIKTALIDSLINNSGLAGDNVNFSLITFNNKYEVQSELTNNRNEIIKMIQAIDTKDEGSEDNNARQIGDAMVKAKEILDGKNPDADKYMVLIASDNLNYSSKKLPNLEDEKYNIMSLNLLEAGNGSLDELHKEMGGTPENYFISEDESGDDIKNPLMGDLADRIISQGRYNDYVIPTELRVNLGDNFTMVSSAKSLKDGIATIEGPQVKYISKGDGKYQAESKAYKVSFTIKPNQDKNGMLSFGDNNVIAYNNLLKEEVTKGIQTPKVNIISPVKDLVHGLDNGLTSGGYSVTEGEVRIANDMKVNIASVATISSSNVNVELRINKDIDLQDLSKIKVYIIKDGNLVEKDCTVTSIGTNSVQNCYNIKLPTDMKGETQVVVRYQCKMPNDTSGEENGYYENNILFNKEERNFRLKREALPDLF